MPEALCLAMANATLALGTADIFTGDESTVCAPTACGTPRASERQSARDALAPFVEWSFEARAAADHVSTYDALLTYSLACRACEIDLNLEGF